LSRSEAGRFRVSYGFFVSGGGVVVVSGLITGAARSFFKSCSTFDVFPGSTGFVSGGTGGAGGREGGALGRGLVGALVGADSSGAQPEASMKAVAKVGLISQAFLLDLTIMAVLLKSMTGIS
jgi:hypothetical protein